MTKAAWQLHFKNKITDAENLYSQGATDVSLLLFCLRAKMLSATEYLHWAGNHYQVPVLSKDFFIQSPPSPSLLKKFQDQYPWSQEFLPIAEWDGLPVIAGLQLPDSMNFPAIFVLASHEDLENTWTAYKSSKKSETSDFSEMTAFAATVIAAKPDQDLFGEDGELILKDDSAENSESSEDESSSEESHESQDASEENSEEIPDGLFGDSIASGVPAPTLSFGGLSAKMIEPAVEPAVEPVMVEENSVVELPPLEARKEVDAMHVEQTRKGPRNSRPVLDTLPSDENTSIDAEPTPEPTSATTVPHAPVKTPQPPLGSPVSYFLEKVRKQNQANFDKEVLACFNQFKTFFKKSMLLAIGDKDRVIKPIMWEGGDYEVRKPSVVEFNLKTPSIFKIVSGTQKPYHGYIVLNDLNESFFESWNYGQIPDHVTIIPLMDQDLVVGMIVGLGEKSCYNKNVLQFSENAVKDLSLKILKTSAKAA